MRLSLRAGAILGTGLAITALTAATPPAWAGPGQSPTGASPAAALAAGGPVAGGLAAGQLGRAYAAYRRLPVADIGGLLPGARVARLGSTRWALAGFTPSNAAPATVRLGFQDGWSYGVFTRSAGHPWTMTGLGGEPLGCGTRLPGALRLRWGLAQCSAAVGGPLEGRRRHRVPGTGLAVNIANVALANVGVADTPASLRWGFDCNPYTTLDGVGAPHRGCGRDQTFTLRDQNQLWCADFAKYVWLKAGLTIDANVLDAAASSFALWGFYQGEPIRFGETPAVGDAVVFYPKGTWRSRVIPSQRFPYGVMADHVGIVVGTANGQVQMVNGDFIGLTNISVQADQVTSLRQYASEVWGPGEKWVVVSPDPSAPPAPAPSPSPTPTP